jgi:ABC-type uncharacterized transport system substrate-binding protein
MVREMLVTDLVAKELEILTQAVPHAMQIGVLWNPTTPCHQLALKAVETAGEKLGGQLVVVHAGTVDDFARETMSQERAAALLIMSSPLTASPAYPWPGSH